MDTIKFLLRALFKLAIVAFFGAIVWWLVITYNPEFRIRSLLSASSSSTSTSEGLLPSPTSFKGIFAMPAPRNSSAPSIGYGQVFNGYGDQGGEQFNYITYRQKGVEMAQGKSEKPVVSGTQTGTAVSNQPTLIKYSQRSLYIRNISIYEGGRTYTGLTFIGEARSSMFLNGRFPIIIAEQATGRVLSVSYAEATSDWTVPGWARFHVKINTITPSASKECLMVFEQARVQNSQTQPARVAIPVMCN